MPKYYRLDSGSIRMYVRINKESHYKVLKHKVDADKWEDSKAHGKGSIRINADLDRISESITEFINSNQPDYLTFDQIDNKLELIIEDRRSVFKRKSIEQYFEEFITEKKNNINPKTKKKPGKSIISSYRNEFNKLIDFRSFELEDINKHLYNHFLNHLLEEKGHTISSAGKSIKRVKNFFQWCFENELPINNRYLSWKSMDEVEDNPDVALNIEQLNSIYQLVIDPVDIYDINKKLGIKTDDKYINIVTTAVEGARKQAVAMSSIGAHREDFWSLNRSHIKGDLLVYKRGKNGFRSVVPFRDNHVFHAKEFADLSGRYFYPRFIKINEYLKYIEILADIPFKITCKTFRKTWASIMYFELEAPPQVNKLALVMKGLGHTNESTTRRYLGIQDDDLLHYHDLLFS